jgi:hypothetical protein
MLENQNTVYLTWTGDFINEHSSEVNNSFPVIKVKNNNNEFLYYCINFTGNNSQEINNYINNKTRTYYSKFNIVNNNNNIKINLKIPDEIINIENEAFKGVSICSLELSQNLKSIGDYAFYKIINKTETETIINNLIIPSTVTYIGKFAFANWKINNDNNLFIDNNLLTINEGAFSSQSTYQNTINNLIIPSSVTNIGNHAFANWKITNNINLFLINSNLQIIGNNAFKSNQNNQSKINNLLIPSNVTHIGNNAFIYWEINNDNNLFIDNNLLKIGDYAFYNNINQNIINNLIIPSSVTYIGHYAFLYWKINNNVNLFTGNNLLTIGNGAFYSDKNINFIRDLTFPSSVTYIGNSAFYYWTIHNDINLFTGNNIIYIGTYAFYTDINNSSTIEKLIIPNSIEQIDNTSFQNWDYFTFQNNSTFNSKFGSNKYISPLSKSIIELSKLAQKLNESNDFERSSGINIKKDNKNIKLNKNEVDMNINKIIIKDTNDYNNIQLNDNIKINNNKQIVYNSSIGINEIKYSNQIIIDDEKITIKTGDNDFIKLENDKIIIDTNTFDAECLNVDLNTNNINFDRIPYITGINQLLTPLQSGIITPFIDNGHLPIPLGWSYCITNIFILKSKYRQINNIKGETYEYNQFDNNKCYNSMQINFNNNNYKVPEAMRVNSDDDNIDENILNKDGAHWKPNNINQYPWQKIKDYNSSLNNDQISEIIKTCYVFQPDMFDKSGIYQPRLDEAHNYNTISTFKRGANVRTNTKREWLVGKYIMKY